jgi:hypothetical protein
VPGPHTTTRLPCRRAAAAATRTALPPGSTRAARGLVDRRRQLVQSPHRYERLLGQGARPAPANANLVAICTQMLATVPALTAGTTPEHGVSRDAATEPGIVDARANGSHPATPLVAQPDGYTASPVRRYSMTPVKNSTSVPHTPARSTSTTTCLGPRRVEEPPGPGRARVPRRRSPHVSPRSGTSGRWSGIVDRRRSTSTGYGWRVEPRDEEF